MTISRATSDYAARQARRLTVIDGLPDGLREIIASIPELNGVQVPRADSAEESVIAAILLDETAAVRAIGEQLQPVDFHESRLGACYAAAITLVDRQEPITLQTLSFELRSVGWLDREGLDEVFLSDLIGRHFTAVGVEAHARLVKHAAAARTLMQLASQVYTVASVSPANLPALLGYAKERLSTIDSITTSAGSTTAEQIVDRYLAGGDLDARPVVPTHIPPLDAALAGGIGKGELAVIAAKTSVGKTALAVRIVTEQMLRGISVGVILVEGLQTKFMHRMAAVQAGVSLTWVERNGWGPGEEQSYQDAFIGLSASHLTFADPVPRTPLGIEQWMRMKARRDGVQHFIIDHIDRVRFDSKTRIDAAYRDALQRWGNLASEEGVVVTVLSQVNREVDWHPELRQLREAGAKEELAQVVLLLSQGDSADYSNMTREAHMHQFASRRWGQRNGVYLNVEVAKFTEGEVGFVYTRSHVPAFYIDRVSGAVMVNGE